MSGYHKRVLENFPMDSIKRVDRPTTIIEDARVKRVDERESGFNRAARGDFGFYLKERHRHFGRSGLAHSMASTGHDWISNSMSFEAYSASGLSTFYGVVFAKGRGYCMSRHFDPAYSTPTAGNSPFSLTELLRPSKITSL